MINKKRWHLTIEVSNLLFRLFRVNFFSFQFDLILELTNGLKSQHFCPIKINNRISGDIFQGVLTSGLSLNHYSKGKKERKKERTFHIKNHENET